MVLQRSPFKTSNDAVKVTETRFNYFPSRFEWRGQPLMVEAIRRCWTSIQRDLAGRPTEHHHFRVRTSDGTFVLSRDVRRNRWTLATDSEPEGRAAA